MKSNQYFKNAALEALRGNWGKAALATLVFFFVACLFSGPSTFSSISTADTLQDAAYSGDIAAMMSIYGKILKFSSISFIALILLFGPLSIGYDNSMRVLLEGDNAIPQNMFKIAFNNFWHKVWGYFLKYILLYLWTLLFIIPGIIKIFSYAMTNFILEENPELSASEAIHRSRMMMKGHKFDLFWLSLSFIGWFFLCCLTFGIGFIWLIPYAQTSIAAFYKELKVEYEANGGPFNE